MSTIHHEILIDTSPEAAWDAARDVGALHTRLVPGFVVDTALAPGVWKAPPEAASRITCA